eukprot:2530942-Prymnesium_polylepis.1
MRGLCAPTPPSPCRKDRRTGCSRLTGGRGHRAAREGSGVRRGVVRDACASALAASHSSLAPIA